MPIAETGQTLRYGDRDAASRLGRVLRTATWLFLVLMLLTVAVWQARQLMLAAQPLPLLGSLGGEFALPSTRSGGESGSATSLTEFRGERVLLNFGYTGCADVCPTALAKMREVVEAFNLEGERIHPVFVTLDPDHDDVEHLRRYLAFFGESFVGMTGSRKQVAEVAALFKVFYERNPEGLGAISHSNHIYLLDRSGRVRSTFDGNVPVGRIIEAVAGLGA